MNPDGGPHMSISTIRFDTNQLRSVWTQLRSDDTRALAEARTGLRADFSPVDSHVWESDEYVYLPVTVNALRHDELERDSIIFALSETHLVTSQPDVPYPPFDKALARMRRTPHLITSPHGVFYALLYALNEASEKIIDHASSLLEDMADDIAGAISGTGERGREVGAAAMQETMMRMNDTEEIVSRVQESQLLLARAARHLRAEVRDHDLAALVDTLTADIDGVKQHASFEHDKVRFLQQSIMTSLDVKQNQIVKAFTIITAVFLPPTLIATFYGMNFTYMPELTWEHGFLSTTLLTLVAALIPLSFIKWKGWLR